MIDIYLINVLNKTLKTTFKILNLFFIFFRS